MGVEEYKAILMADLSGYTALTETHGAVSAADLIDKYVGIVKESLVGDSQLKERTGDEVMIVSNSPDSLLSTAAMIIKKTSKEDNFLQVHGGLHYGKVLHRGHSYFGSTINLTARITSKANPGTFWCSEEFIDALTDRSLFELRSQGLHSFKNVKGVMELTELVNEKSESFLIDPVCRMLILNKELAVKHPQSDDLYFCSNGCMHIYSSTH